MNDLQLTPFTYGFASLPYKFHTPTKYFKVLKAALWIRLNNLKKLNLLTSMKVRPCFCCGNANFSMFAEYYGICGTPLSNGLKGVLKVKHPKIFSKIVFHIVYHLQSSFLKNL